MLRLYSRLLLLSFLCIAGYNTAQAQQTLDSTDVFYFDNTSDNNTGTTGTLMNDPGYKEFPPTNPVAGENDGFYTNNSATLYWGGNHRRASRTGSGNNSGAHANYYCTVPVAAHYLVYHHANSGNSTSNAYVKFYKFLEPNPVDSMRYNMLLNNTPDIPSSYGSWYPLGIVTLEAVTDALTVEIGLDAASPNTLRCDALALVKSHKTGPDIEFGNRRYTRTIVSGIDTIKHEFMTQRVPLGFSETTFKSNSYSEKQLPVFNLGNAPLTITGYTSGTTRYSITNTFPMTIEPGSKGIITVRFSPKGEETTRDTIILLNNDADEPEARLPLIGTGVNYNFILNASLTGEPHWNVPTPGGKFSYFGTYLSSTPTPWPYPITGGNSKSIVNISAEPSTAVYYEFVIPDTLSGKYFLEYSGPAGSSNAGQNITVDVVTPFYANPDPALADTQRVTGFNTRAVTTNALWARVGGNKVFELNPGDTTMVRFTNPQQGTDYLRADLLRVRLVPVAATVSTSLDPARVLAWSPVSIYDSIRQANLNFTRNIVIGSNGETPLRIDSLYLKSGELFHIANMPSLPITLPAVDGKYDLRIDFLPDSIKSESDSLIIVSNAPNDGRIAIRMNGSGVGTGITVDDSDPSIYISPAEIQQWTGAPDPNNMDKWYRVTGNGGNNDNRLLHYIYFNSAQYPETVEWFPNFPNRPGGAINEEAYFKVYAQLSVGSSISSPAAKYLIYHAGSTQPDTFIVNQNSTANGGNVPSSGLVQLGGADKLYKFIRGGQDVHGSSHIFGYVKLVNDTALVSAVYRDSLYNKALQDSFVLRADAMIFEEAYPSGVSDASKLGLPTAYELSQNYPNPFNPTTTIRFDLPMDSKVDLRVYDILGREVAVLMSGDMRAGKYTVNWNGRNSFNQQVATGMYIYRIRANNFVQTKKMMMIK